MAWRSTREIVDHLGLESSPDDFESLSRELHERLAELHPDKTGGQFDSEECEREYQEVRAARDFVRAQDSTNRDVVPVDQLPALLNALKVAQNSQSNSEDREIRAEVRDENRKDLHARYTAPRVGSGVFAGITGALFTFSESLADHPVLGELAGSYLMQLSLVVLSAYSAIFFGLTWYFEQRAEARVDFMLSEEGMQMVFDELVRRPELEAGGRRFSRRTVARIVSSYCGSRSRSGALPIMIGRQRVKPSTIDRIVQLHVSEWENRGVIREVEQPSVERLYELDQQVARSMRGV
jgi:hypothetical protein